MAGSLYRLIYCSRNAIAQTIPGAATAEGFGEELRTILSTSRRRNAAENVTGALLLTASGFAQVLEGPREVVECMFERISSDPRHADVTALSFTPTERRCFPDWSMGFCSKTDVGQPDPLAHLLTETTFAGPRVITGSDVLRMLEAVVEREDDWVVS